MRILLVSEYSTANGDVDVAGTFGGKFENCRPACLLCVTHSCCRWLLFVGGLKLGIGYGLREGGEGQAEAASTAETEAAAGRATLW